MVRSAFNLSHTRDAVTNAKTEVMSTSVDDDESKLGQSAIGYLIDWRDSASPALLYDLLEAGANVRVATAPFTALTTDEGSINFGYGTLFVAPKLQESIPQPVLSLLAEAHVAHVESGYEEETSGNRSSFIWETV